MKRILEIIGNKMKTETWRFAQLISNRVPSSSELIRLIFTHIYLPALHKEINKQSGWGLFYIFPINGPNLSHSDTIIKEAMNAYWKSKGSPWHILRTTILEQLKEHAGGSQAIHRLVKQASKLQFMEKWEPWNTFILNSNH